MDLYEREAIIETCQQAIEQSWVEIGKQLLIIRDERLYRKTHSTFEGYCEERWGFSREKAWELIGGSEVIENLGEMSSIDDIPRTHVRPLTKLEPWQQRQAWQSAKETAPKGRMTERHVRKTVNELFHKPEEEEEEANENEEDEWDDRISEVLIPALGLLGLDPERVSRWSFEYRQECLERIDRAIDALTKVRQSISRQYKPILVHGDN